MVNSISTSNDKALRILESLPEVFMKLSDKEQELSLAIYRALGKGIPVARQELVASSSMTEEQVNEILDRWTGVFYSGNNEIIGYWGLATLEMTHKMKIDDKLLYGWCAWDTLFIPQLLSKSATIVSKDHLTNEELIIKIDQDGNLTESNEKIKLSMLIADEKSITEDVVNSFCHYIHFFKNEENARKWTQENEGTFIINLDEAIELSQLKNRIQFKNEFGRIEI